MASRLWYFLWGSMPDAALFEAAASNQLGTPERTGLAALERPAVVGIVSASNHPSPDCPTEAVRTAVVPGSAAP